MEQIQEETLMIYSQEEMLRLPSRINDFIDNQFLVSYGLNSQIQLGLVCKQLQANVNMCVAKGASPFFRYKGDSPNWIIQGEKVKGSIEYGIGYLNNIQLELIGEVRNTDFYNMRLVTENCVGLHHLGIYQKNIALAERRLNEDGFATVFEGSSGVGHTGFQFKYIDTRAEIGCYLELLEQRLFGFYIPPSEWLISLLASLQQR